jgi:hypothetical protein
MGLGHDPLLANEDQEDPPRPAIYHDLDRDTMLSGRGDLLDPAVLTESARENGAIYGLFGISVFAEVGGNGSCCSPPERSSSPISSCGTPVWPRTTTSSYEDLEQLGARILGCEPGESARRAVVTPRIQLRSDLNAEDDSGQNWALRDNASDPSVVRVGAVLVAGTARFWSVVRMTAVDADGQVHFVQLKRTDPAVRAVLAAVA